MTGHSLLRKRYGNLVWDGLLRGSGIAALIAIPTILFLPSVGPLVGFLLVTIWVNGPIAPLLPATYEPILMLYGRLYPPFLIGMLGIAGTIYVEYLNYRLYRRVLHSNMLSRFRRSKVMEWVCRLFSRAPFFTVWLCSWSPLPYWSVRFISPLVGYPVSRHLWATFLGRFPRLWFFAALGGWWKVDIRVLIWISVGSILLAAVVSLIKWRPRAWAGARHDEAIEEVVPQVAVLRTTAGSRSEG